MDFDWKEASTATGYWSATTESKPPCIKQAPSGEPFGTGRQIESRAD